MKTLNQLKEMKKKNLYQSDIATIKNLVYNDIDTLPTRISYILEEMKNKTEIEDLICEKVQNDWLFTLGRLEGVKFEDEYYTLDWYDNPMNIEDWDIENRLDKIIAELEGNWI